MKVALLFFGQPRFVDRPEIAEVYKKYIIDRYTTDVFCHAWWKPNGGEYDYSTWSNISNCPIPDNAIDIIKQNYNPTLLAINAPRKFTLPTPVKDHVDKHFTGKHPSGNHWNYNNYSNILSQLWSIQQISNLFSYYSEGLHYDWVVLARYDTVLVNFPDLTECNPELFYLPGHHPRFPDTIQAFGTKFLQWSKNVYNDIEDEQVYSSIWEPSPEAFKMGSFLSRFNTSDLAPYPMDAHCIRK
jgi:hypothetical protein